MATLNPHEVSFGWKDLVRRIAILISSGVLWGAAAGWGTAAEAGRVTSEADLLDAYTDAQIDNCMACELRRPGSAGGIKQDALFEHPHGNGRPARVTLSLDLPSIEEEELLILSLDVAISDGITPGPKVDGVRFRIEVDGQSIWATQSRAMQWRSHAIDLTPWSGNRIALSLCTESIRTSNYDWAMWGRPSLLRVKAPTALPASPTESRTLSTSVARGVLVVRAQPGATIRLRPAAGDSSLEWRIRANDLAPNTPAWFVGDFNFTNAGQVHLEWNPVEALEDVRWAVYPPKLRLVHVTPAQAVVLAGSAVPLVVEVKNDGRGASPNAQARLAILANGRTIAETNLPAMEPGAGWRHHWDWHAPSPAPAKPLHLQARLFWNNETTILSHHQEVFPAEATGEILQNDHLKVEFFQAHGGFAYARIHARQENRWQELGVWNPLFKMVTQTRGGPQDWPARPVQCRRSISPDHGETLEIRGTVQDPDDVAWNVLLQVKLEAKEAKARIQYRWSAEQPRQVLALGGPNIYVGDGTLGGAKTWGLFPGLEYLFGAERSSNPRDFAPALAERTTPHPHKITIPLMAVTLGPDSQKSPERSGRFFAPDSLKDQPFPERTPTPDASPALPGPFTAALCWDPQQRWDGQHAFPSSRFASPNLDESMRNHRMALFLPSCPKFVPENATQADPPVPMPAHQPWSLSASLSVSPEPVLAALREWVREQGGLPQPNPWPRSFQEALTLCRVGFLETVWDDATEKWRHCIGWKPTDAPGYAALLWLDARLAEKVEDRQRSQHRVDRVATRMLQGSGPGRLTSQAGCHIMQWEFPFYYGYLPEALTTLDGLIRQLIRTQESDGSWRYRPGNAQQAELGQAGDSVLGTCANRASTLLRYARITGDAEAWAAGENALRFMEQFRVPRGGQTWECPMYEPDILAAAYAIRAYHDAYRISRNPRWLQNAVYWAETGLPFIYLWSLPDRPMMLGATIPVFGSTFYTHTWLAVPVQWCGLVYACHLFHLAEELKRSTPALAAATDSPYTLSLHFSSSDWKRLVELITVSALYQQFPDGDKIGTYPDSIVQFQERKPAFINPEDILVNLLALHGHSPDIKTSRLQTDAGLYIVSSGATIANLQKAQSTLRFDLNHFPGDVSHTLVVGLEPRAVRVDDTLLPRATQPVRQEPGWWWDAPRRRLYLVAPHTQAQARVEIRGSDE